MKVDTSKQQTLRGENTYSFLSNLQNSRLNLPSITQAKFVPIRKRRAKNKSVDIDLKASSLLSFRTDLAVTVNPIKNVKILKQDIDGFKDFFQYNHTRNRHRYSTVETSKLNCTSHKQKTVHSTLLHFNKPSEAVKKPRGITYYDAFIERLARRTTDKQVQSTQVFQAKQKEKARKIENKVWRAAKTIIDSKSLIPVKPLLIKDSRFLAEAAERVRRTVNFVGNGNEKLSVEGVVNLIQIEVETIVEEIEANFKGMVQLKNFSSRNLKLSEENSESLLFPMINKVFREIKYRPINKIKTVQIVSPVESEAEEEILFTIKDTEEQKTEVRRVEKTVDYDKLFNMLEGDDFFEENAENLVKKTDKEMFTEGVRTEKENIFETVEVVNTPKKTVLTFKNDTKFVVRNKMQIREDVQKKKKSKKETFKRLLLDRNALNLNESQSSSESSFSSLIMDSDQTLITEIVDETVSLEEDERVETAKINKINSMRSVEDKKSKAKTKNMSEKADNKNNSEGNKSESKETENKPKTKAKAEVSPNKVVLVTKHSKKQVNSSRKLGFEQELFTKKQKTRKKRFVPKEEKKKRRWTMIDIDVLGKNSELQSLFVISRQSPRVASARNTNKRKVIANLTKQVKKSILKKRKEKAKRREKVRSARSQRGTTIKEFKRVRGPSYVSLFKNSLDQSKQQSKRNIHVNYYSSDSEEVLSHRTDLDEINVSRELRNANKIQKKVEKAKNKVKDKSSTERRITGKNIDLSVNSERDTKTRNNPIKKGQNSTNAVESTTLRNLEEKKTSDKAQTEKIQSRTKKVISLSKKKLKPIQGRKEKREIKGRSIEANTKLREKNRIKEELSKDEVSRDASREFTKREPNKRNKDKLSKANTEVKERKKQDSKTKKKLNPLKNTKHQGKKTNKSKSKNKKKQTHTILPALSKDNPVKTERNTTEKLSLSSKKKEKSSSRVKTESLDKNVKIESKRNKTQEKQESNEKQETIEKQETLEKHQETLEKQLETEEQNEEKTLEELFIKELKKQMEEEEQEEDVISEKSQEDSQELDPKGRITNKTSKRIAKKRLTRKSAHSLDSNFLTESVSATLKEEEEQSDSQVTETVSNVTGKSSSSGSKVMERLKRLLRKEMEASGKKDTSDEELMKMILSRRNKGEMQTLVLS